MKRVIGSIVFFLLLVCIFCGIAAAESIADFVEVSGNYYDLGNNWRDSAFIYSDSMLLNDSSSMSGDLCKASVMLASSAYKSNYIEPLMDQMGYDCKTYDYASRTLEDNDRVAYAIGKKERDGYVFYCVAVRGSMGGEWISNFNIGDPANNGGKHVGFHTAANMVSATLDNYFANDDYSESNRILWFTGHSRGAAVANILAAKYTEESKYALPENIFGYNFACPRVSKNAKSYNNIFNFNNSGDVVISVPLEDWGYERHGKDYNHAFTGDLLFELRYSAEIGKDYGATYDTLAYEGIIKKIFPTEESLNEPRSRFASKLLGWLMGGKDDIPFSEIMYKYGPDAIPVEYLWNKVCEKLSLEALYKVFDDDASVVIEQEVFLRNAIEATKEMTEEEFIVWTSEKDNYNMIVEISKTTGKTIAKYSDLHPVLNTVLELGPIAYDVGEIIGYLLDISQNGGGNIMESIYDGHRQSAYVLNLNAMYFGYYAYEGSTTTSVTIPGNVTTIGYGCFADSSIVTVQGMERIAAIGGNAFYNCEGLVVPLDYGPCYVGSGAFVNCSALVGTVKFSDGITNIPASTFYNCSGLTEIIIPDSVKEIGELSFYNCGGLTEIIIPDSVEEIGQQSFCNCGGLKKVTMPISCNYQIDWGVDWHRPTFLGCSNVEEIVFTSGNGAAPAYANSSLGDSSLASISRESLKKVIFSEGITEIGEHMLYDCYNVTEVVLPETLTTINDCAFSGCINWEGEFPINENITSIGVSAFKGCEKLTGVLKLPDNIIHYAGSAFVECVGLNELIIPSSTESLGASMFRNCTGLKKITMPISCTHNLDLYPTFKNCTNVEEIIYTVGNGTVFESANNNYMHTLSYYAKDSLIKVTYEEGITTLPVKALYKCNKVTEVQLPSTLTKISDYAFYGCDSLETMKIPSCVSSIGSNAFSSLSNLILTVYQDSYAHSWCMENNVAFELIDIIILPSEKAWMLPKYLTVIKEEAFLNVHMVEVVIPDGVTSIGKRAFAGCSDLMYAFIPDSVLEIASDAFEGCEELVFVCSDDSVAAQYADTNGITRSNG